MFEQASTTAGQVKLNPATHAENNVRKNKYKARLDRLPVLRSQLHHRERRLPAQLSCCSILDVHC